MLQARMSHFGQSLRTAPDGSSTYDGRPTLPWRTVDLQRSLVQGEVAECSIHVSYRLICNDGGGDVRVQDQVLVVDRAILDYRGAHQSNSAACTSP